jgi:RNA polymerase sigma-54 factor
MKKELRIELDTSLKLKQTLKPRLLQVIKLYTMTALELREYLLQQIEENILLSEKELKREDLEKEKDEREEIDLKEFFQVFCESDYYFKKGEDENEEDEIYLLPASSPSLYERLSFQIDVVFKDEKKRRIAERIVSYINKKGFLEKSPELIASELKIPVDELEKIRRQIMYMDPVGVGAVDLRESLLIQMEVRGLKDTLAYEIVNKHFDIMCMPKEEIGRVLNLSRRDIEDAFAIIKKLNPRPGETYSDEKPQYVIPEFAVRYRDGNLEIDYLKGFLPKIRLNKKYLMMLESKDTKEDVKRFLREYLKKAKELFEFLEERRRKIEKVLNFIVEYQRDFFINPEGKLRPVSQSEAARRLSISVSTLNRIITGKYISTPKGIFELKFFFPRGFRTKEGKSFDREEVKKIIKELIENEDKDNPLTDDEIKIILEQKGIKVVRRTVCVLRRELNIPSSKQRKK